MPVKNLEAAFNNRVQTVRDFARIHNVGRAEVDMSGGIDSFFVGDVVVEALGAENVVFVFSDIQSSQDARERAEIAARFCGLPLVDLDLTPVFNLLRGICLDGIRDAYGSDTLSAVKARMQADPTIEGSLRSTLRAPTGRFVNRLMGGGIRHGTGNRDEDEIVRFFQKGGDGEVDTNVSEFLSKGEIFQIARWRVLCSPKGLACPEAIRIVKARPSPDLWGKGEAHNDEDEYSSWLRYTLPAGHTWYSYISMETGEYVSVGLLERMSQFIKYHPEEVGPVFDYFDTWSDRGFYGDDFLAVRPPDPHQIRNATLMALTDQFQDMTYDDVYRLFEALSRAERVTRHKFNPNIPTLGSRQSLVGAGILTDDLPIPEKV